MVEPRVDGRRAGGPSCRADFQAWQVHEQRIPRISGVRRTRAWTGEPRMMAPGTVPATRNASGAAPAIHIQNFQRKLGQVHLLKGVSLSAGDGDVAMETDAADDRLDAVCVAPSRGEEGKAWALRSVGPVRGTRSGPTLPNCSRQRTVESLRPSGCESRAEGAADRSHPFPALAKPEARIPARRG